MKPNFRKEPTVSSDVLCCRDGFALIATISVMVLLVMIALAMLSLSTIELRNSRHDDAMNAARANARMGLMIAIGELQKSTGPDQRITATAEVLSESTSVSDGRAHWVGVWDTSGYAPSSPDQRSFVKWLVSSPDAGMSSTLGSVSASTTADDLLIFEGEDDVSSVRVPKVSVNEGSYAYWVEDEGVKADLAWNEGEFNRDQRKQAARLAAAPGVDYEVFQGPFSGKVSYPIQYGGGNAWLDHIDKAISTADLPLVVGDTTHRSDWLRSRRHDMTIGSRGVMADVKKGGLRRDLSLAFEMDGEANLSWNGSAYANPPTKFNRQWGEFVGETPGSDAQTGIQSVGGLTARYIYGDTSSSGQPFSGDIQDSSAIIRGPTWWTLRDYANSYKRLTGTPGNYQISSRATFPNGSEPSGPYTVLPIAGNVAGNLLWDQVYHKNKFYLERPFEANYAPVMLGYTSLLSVLSTPDSAPGEEKLALGIDPIFFLWNPYNHRLKAERYIITFRAALPGQIRIWLDGSPRPAADVQDYIARAAGYGNLNVGSWLSYSITNVDLAPGEVKVYSPPTDPSLVSPGSRHPYNTDAFPGASLDAGSGALITKFPPSWSEIKVSDFSSIRVAFAMTGATPENFVGTHLQDPATKNAALKNISNFGPTLRSCFPYFTYSDEMARVDKFEPAKVMNQVTMAEAAGPYTSASIAGSKQFCGVFSLLASPANFSGGNATPPGNLRAVQSHGTGRKR
ncbi:MAG: hypothetical protein H7A51_18280 [Akkermansiaceae bacterium]|nr:hypothetical protein [Akkermansiaceae bacterium]